MYSENQAEVLMSDKSNCLMMILNKLDRREHTTVKSLMGDLEVAERTLHRYITTLQSSGFPIYYDRAKGSYVFGDNFSLSEPGITGEEKLALHLSRKLLHNFGSGMEASLDSIEKKLAKKVDSPPDKIILAIPQLPERTGHQLEIIHRAITNFQRLEVGYHSLYADERTARAIDPYYLFFEEGFWNIRAFCHLRNDWRTFAVDRILSIKTLPEYFVPVRIEPADELAGAFGSFIDGEETEVVLKFDREIKAHVMRKKWHQSQQARELPDKSLEVRFTINNIEGLKRWLYQWIPHVKVVSPEDLRADFTADLKKALEGAQPDRI
jgi:predicted DNA-binding transcriptional regulator YafY